MGGRSYDQSLITVRAYVKKAGNVLIAGAALFFIETAFEMYVLTALRGPQMIGFGIAHGGRGLLLIVMLSAVFYVCLAVFALVVIIRSLLGKALPPKNYPRIMLIVLGVQLIHTTLLLTYDRWSRLL